MISNYLCIIEPNIGIYDNERVFNAFRKHEENRQKLEKELRELLKKD
jgi:hypothetical protein